MKLEIGKLYLNRLGNTITIVGQDTNGYFLDAKGGSYYDVGCKMLSQESQGDLVVERAAPYASRVPNGSPHADLIRALLDGKQVQWMHRLNPAMGDTPWVTFTSFSEAISALVFSTYLTFRLKPENAVSWHGLWRDGRPSAGFASREELQAERWHRTPDRILRLEINSKTMEVISTKTEAP